MTPNVRGRTTTRASKKGSVAEGSQKGSLKDKRVLARGS